MYNLMQKRLIITLCVLLLVPALCCAKNYLVLLDDGGDDIRLFESYRVTDSLDKRLKADFNARIDMAAITVNQRPNPINRFLTNGYELIIGLGPTVSETIYNSAINNDRYRYAMVDTARGNLPANAMGFSFAYAEAGYAAGYAAALVSQTGVIGFIGGRRISQISDFAKGFGDGARAANPDIKLRSVYLDNFFDAYAARGKATEMYRNGADVVCHAAGPGGQGVLEAARNYGLWVIAAEPVRNNLPNNVCMAVVINYNAAVYQACRAAEETGFKGGSVQKLNFGNGGLVLNYGAGLNANTVSKLNQAVKNISAGKIIVLNAHGRRVN